jgi:hypothetical protein
MGIEVEMKLILVAPLKYSHDSGVERNRSDVKVENFRVRFDILMKF